jgi:hypothetical protein
MYFKETSVFAKILALISLIALSIWLGTYFAKLLTVYYVFEGPELILRDYINQQNMDALVRILLPLHSLQLISYIVFVVIFIMFLLVSKISIKYNGWLFIIIMIILVTLPFEIYLMIIDYKFVQSIMSNNFNPTQLIELLRERIKVLSSYPLVALFSYISIFYFIVFQPFTKINKK